MLSCLYKLYCILAECLNLFSFFLKIPTATPFIMLYPPWQLFQQSYSQNGILLTFNRMKMEKMKGNNPKQHKRYGPHTQSETLLCFMFFSRFNEILSVASTESFVIC